MIFLARYFFWSLIDRWYRRADCIERRSSW